MRTDRWSRVVLASLDPVAIGALCISGGLLIIVVGRAASRSRRSRGRRAPAPVAVTRAITAAKEAERTPPPFHAISRQRTSLAIGVGLVCMVVLLAMLIMSVGTHREQQREACWAQLAATAEIRGVQLSASTDFDRSYRREFYESMSDLETYGVETCNRDH